jgi:PAS domain S-box-containing protein
MDKSDSVSLRNRHPTVGYLVAGTTNAYQAAVLAGLIEGARERGANLISFAGGQLHRAPNDPFAHLRNAVYDLATANSVDGLVINSTLGNYATVEELGDFCAHYRPLPTVCIGEAIPGAVSILVDNDKGMRQVIAHLIERHGYRRIAFIRGPMDNDEAEQRYRVYTAVLAEYGLALDPDLVALGDFFFASGAEAIHLLLDERRVDVQAIVAANDDMALGALEALQARGMRVPDEVAIVGFDDVIDVRAVTPSLTTVRQPLSEQGKQAVEKLLALLAGEPVPEGRVLPTELVIRRSCGCLDPAVVQAAAGGIARSAESLRAGLAVQQECVLAEVTQAMETYGGRPSPEWGKQLWEAFTAELAGHSPGVFLLALRDVLHQATTSGGDVAVLQGAVSALRRHTLPCLNGETLQRAEDLWQQARVVIELTAWQRQAYQSLQAERRINTLQEIEAALLTTFDVDGLMNTLAEGLPRLGIPSCYLALYENSQSYECPHPAEWSRLILAYTEEGRVKLEPGGQRFRSRELVPEDMRPRGRPFTFAVESLCFQKDQLGFVIFEAGPPEEFIFDALRRLISSALQGALLVQRVQARSAELVRQQYILDTFMETVPDCIYFKDLSSRFTRTNRSHALRMGVSDPVEEIGKSDFDFFSEEQARIRYEKEQEIIRTGQPILDSEETDDQGRWTLATKMPLRDEHGNIIGTFGISRDITERKRAEEQLQRYSAELAQNNQELQQFAYTISHDLRAPLVNLKGFTAELVSSLNVIRPTFEPLLLQMSEKERAEVSPRLLEDVPEALSFIDASATRIDHLTNALLKLSRLGRRELYLERVNMNALVRGILETRAHQIKQRGVQVTIGPLPEVVADLTSMEQVMGHILNNAILYLEAGRPGEIEITGERNGDETIFRVRDNGRGIAPEDMDKVFAPFRRAGKQDVPGEGMGLAYVQTLVRRHGGRVWCESGLGMGTTFTLTVPHQLTQGGRHV